MMPWYIWLPLLAITLHQAQTRQDEVIQIIFILLTTVAFTGLIFSASWLFLLALFVVLLGLPICELRREAAVSIPCDRPCLKKPLCYRPDPS